MPDCTQFVNAGIYALESETVARVLRDQHFNMTILNEQLIDTETHVGCFQLQEFWLDIAHPGQFEIGTQDYHTVLQEADKFYQSSS